MQMQMQTPAHAAILHEDIGELKIHDLLLRPNFMLKEPTQGAFSIGESSFALRWELEKKYFGVVRVGPRTLLNPLAHFSSTVNDDLFLVEAFAEYHSPYGRFRLGRLPVEFGWEGRQWERNLIFPRSLLFQNRAMMLRDVGVAYDITHNGYYTGFVVHDGEGDRDVDGRIWYTARWGYKADNWEIGLAGQTGSTKPVATSSSGDTLAGVDPSEQARWRLGGLYSHIDGRHWYWTFETYLGEREQKGQVGKFGTGHMDYGYEFTKEYSAHIRLDAFDPDMSVDRDLQRNVSLAFELSNPTHSSNLILIGTKVLEASHQVGNDELRLVWSLSPSGVVRF
jgi:hypothetical protein